MYIGVDCGAQSLLTRNRVAAYDQAYARYCQAITAESLCLT